MFLFISVVMVRRSLHSTIETLRHLLKEPNLETPSLTCPEVCLLSGSRSLQVNNHCHSSWVKDNILAHVLEGLIPSIMTGKTWRSSWGEFVTETSYITEAGSQV